MEPEEQALLDAQVSMAAFERARANDFKPIALDPYRTEPYDYYDPRTAMQEGRISDVPAEPTTTPEPPRVDYEPPPRIAGEVPGKAPTTISPEMQQRLERLAKSPQYQSPEKQLDKSGVPKPMIPLISGVAVAAAVEPTPAGELAALALIGTGIGITALKNSGVLDKLGPAIQQKSKELKRTIGTSDLAITLKNPERNDSLLGDPFAGAEAFKEGVSLKAAEVRDNINVFLLTNPVKTDILDKWPTIESFKEGMTVLSKQAADYISKAETAKTAVADTVTDLVNDGMVRAKEAESFRTWLQGQVNSTEASKPAEYQELPVDTVRKALENLDSVKTAYLNASKAYVATLNPQPLQGDYSDAANAAIAAAGVNHEIQRLLGELPDKYAQSAYQTNYKEAVKEGATPQEATKEATKEAQKVYTQTVDSVITKAANQVASQTGVDAKAQPQVRQAAQTAFRTLTVPRTSTTTRTSTITRTTPVTRTSTLTGTTTATGTATAPPPPFIPQGEFKTTKKKPTKKELATAEAFPMGFGWWVTWGTSKGKRYKRFYYGQEPPAGIKNVRQGKGEAYRGIQQQKGDASVTGILKLGAVTARITNPTQRPGKSGAISFSSQPRRGITPKRPRIGR